ncbi:MAG: chorismate mutase [Clostridia bacterium]|nr:chorismate mutase [Clostridia bacterium]
MDLNEIRKQIDVVDDEIAKLYEKRMQLGKEVAEEKNKKNIPITNLQREREIISRVTKDMPDEIKLYAKRVYETLFETSKAYQSEFSVIDSKVTKEITKALAQSKEFPLSAKVACQGVEGAYAMSAATKMFQIPDIVYFKDWDAVFTSVEKGFCEYGVLPIENSLVGSVNKVYDLIKKHNCYIVGGVKLKVSHSLLVKKGTKLEDIKEIISHEQAIAQCEKYIKSLNKDIKVTTCLNTALAAEIVSKSDRNDLACISSSVCKDIYGLESLGENIQDNKSNFTRFIAISKEMKIFNGADKISIMANLKHEPGSLNRILNEFSTLGLNLTKLESRPLEGSPFEFTFYFDFDGDIKKVSVQNLIANLERETTELMFLGCYKELI